jgi:hypothetical protein
MYQAPQPALLLNTAPAGRDHEEAAMRAHIDRLMTGIGRDRHQRVRLVPRSGRPRRARTTFVALVDRVAPAH